jgi:hypothetical protein
VREELHRALGVIVSASGAGFFGCKSKARNTPCGLADWRVLNGIFWGIADIGPGLLTKHIDDHRKN